MRVFPFADLRADFVDAEAGTGGEGQVAGLYSHPVAVLRVRGHARRVWKILAADDRGRFRRADR
jgi:hypothetical protein